MIKLKKIIKHISLLKFKGNIDTQIKTIKSLHDDDHNKTSLTWVSEKNIPILNGKFEGNYIVPNSDEIIFKPNINYIIVNNPRDTFRLILEKFFVEKQKFYISKSSKLMKNLKLSKKIFVGENVVIEEDCEIGNNVIIDHNTIIKKNTKIGNNVIIGCNCTIGNNGFGYEKNEFGKYEFIPHLGNVIIKDNVRIGNNTCIDRALIGSTIISENVKIDNLVHIAHGVVIGRNSLIIANSMIAGSTIIEDNVWVSPSASIINKLKIGSNSLIGMGSVVLKNVDDNDIIIGNPGKSKFKK